MASAKVMFLDLHIPDDDPLRPAKMFVSTVAPGFRLFEKAGNVEWESDFIWLVIVNEEDGLDFKLRQTIDGKREVQALWRDGELEDTSKLRDYLRGDPLWDIYQLRATVLLQGRVEAQIETLRELGSPQRGTTIRETPWRLAEQLRALESGMLVRAIDALESQVRKQSFPAPMSEYCIWPRHIISNIKPDQKISKFVFEAFSHLPPTYRHSKNICTGKLTYATEVETPRISNCSAVSGFR